MENNSTWSAALIQVTKLEDRYKLASLTLLPTAKIYDVISNLEATGLQIVLIVDDAHSLLGTITDGDIRRGLLSGFTMTDSVKKIMVQTPITVCDAATPTDAAKLMTVMKIAHIPVVNKNKKLEDIFIINQGRSAPILENKFVIMAGGFGKRLMPLTENCPKPMLPVNGKPLLEHIIERAKSQGFRNFVLSLYYLPDVIREYFQDGARWNIRIEYIEEEEPLGTAGALSLLSRNENMPLIITNGDVINELNYVEFLKYHIEKKSFATMAVRPHSIQNQFGVVHTDGARITHIEEKPIYTSLINAGIYVLNPQALLYLQKNMKIDMPELFSCFKQKGEDTMVFPIHEVWYDVGRQTDLKDATEYLDRTAE